MYARLINLVAAILFFVTALRDWFWPGMLQISHRKMASFAEPLIWVVMGLVCVGAMRRSPKKL
jgi:predicted permease